MFLHVYMFECILAGMVDTVQQRLTAIAEPNRFRIVELLGDGPRSVGGIVDDLGLGQPQVSRHLRLLAEAGMVEATKQAQRRIYRLRPEPMRELNDWTQRFAGLWSDRMDRLDAFLETDGLETDRRGEDGLEEADSEGLGHA